MTQEALKLALDALETHTAIKHPQQIHYRDKAITAIKEALREQAMREVQRLGQEIEQEPVVGTKTWFEDGKVVTQHLTAKDIYKEPEQEPVAWLITDEKINSLQVDSIQRLVDRARHAHMTDIKLRINGQDEWHQADWLKHLTRTTPPQRTEQNFCSRCGKRVGGIDSIHTCTPPMEMNT